MLKIIKSGPLAPSREGRVMTVTVQGDSADEVMGLAAKKLAYEARVQYGFTNAGISSITGVLQVQQKDGKVKPARQFRLELGL